MAMKKGVRAGASYKAQYSAYKATGAWLKNKVARLENVVKQQPNNKVAIAALERAKSGKATYVRNRKAIIRGSCKPNPLHVFPNPMVSAPISIKEQVAL